MDALLEKGIVVLGNIDPTRLEILRNYAQSSETRQSHGQRQIVLDWNSLCDAVYNDFELVSVRQSALFT